MYTTIILKCLVVVLVAQSLIGGIQDLPDGHITAHAVHIDRGIESKWVSTLIVTIDGADTVGILVLPDAPVAVNEAVVKPEDGVSRRGPNVKHNRSNAIVAPGMRTGLSASSHASKVAHAVAVVNVALVAVSGPLGVVVTSEAVRLVVLTRTDIKSEVGELLVKC